MKRLFKKCIAIAFVAVMVATNMVITYAADEINVTINGQVVVFPDQRPAIVDGRTLVPVAGVFQALGFDVQWDGNIRQAILKRASDMVVITIDSSTFIVNGTSHILDVPAQIIGGRTMLPIAVVLRSVGYEVDWDGETSTVAITSYIPMAVVMTEQPHVPEEEPVVPEPDLIDEDEQSIQIPVASESLANLYNIAPQFIGSSTLYYWLDTDPVERLYTVNIFGQTPTTGYVVRKGTSLVITISPNHQDRFYFTEDNFFDRVWTGWGPISGFAQIINEDAVNILVTDWFIESTMAKFVFDSLGEFVLNLPGGFIRDFIVVE